MNGMPVILGVVIHMNVSISSQYSTATHLFPMQIRGSSLSFMFPCVPRAKTVRVKFTEEEDRKLRELFEQYGEDWSAIASEMSGRCIRQCKERWYEYLNPSIIKRDWTPNEDSLLIQKVSEYGRKWIRIQPFFPGRTSTSLKNRFNRLCRRARRGFRMYLFAQSSGSHSDSCPTCSDTIHQNEPEEAEMEDLDMDDMFLDWMDVFLD